MEIKLINEGVSYDMILPFKKYTGEDIIVKTTGNPVFKDDKIIGVVGIIMDLSSRDNK